VPVLGGFVGLGHRLVVVLRERDMRGRADVVQCGTASMISPSSSNGFPLYSPRHVMRLPGWKSDSTVDPKK
jgi:hypothetical protein